MWVVGHTTAVIQLVVGWRFVGVEGDTAGGS
jgi:hypothetical protein